MSPLCIGAKRHKARRANAALRSEPPSAAQGCGEVARTESPQAAYAGVTSPLSYIPVAAYLIFAFFAHMLDNDARSLQERYKMTAEPHLVWHWLTPAPIYSLIVYFIFLLAPLVLSGNFVLLGVVLAALAFSIVSYASAWGSVWCYAIHSIVVVLCLVR